MQYKDLDKLFVSCGFWEKDNSCELFYHVDKWHDFLTKLYEETIPKYKTWSTYEDYIYTRHHSGIDWSIDQYTYKDDKLLWMQEWVYKGKYKWCHNRSVKLGDQIKNKFAFYSEDITIPEDILDKIKKLLNEFLPFIKEEKEKRITENKRKQDEEEKKELERKIKREKEEEEERQLKIKRKQQWELEERIRKQKRLEEDLKIELERGNNFKAICRMIVRHGNSVAPIVSYFLENNEWSYLDFEKELKNEFLKNNKGVK